MAITDIVRESMEAFLAQDRYTAEELIADDFRFTSPQDDHIDRATYFERCFPTAFRIDRQEIMVLVPAGDEHVFLLYEYVLKSGETYRNAEFITVCDGKLVETQVFFGGRYDT